jgi:hypothetical protein
VGGTTYHVLKRANYRSRLFKQGADCEAFLGIVEGSLTLVPTSPKGFLAPFFLTPFFPRATCSMDVPFSTARLDSSIWYLRQLYRGLFVSSFG